MRTKGLLPLALFELLALFAAAGAIGCSAEQPRRPVGTCRENTSSDCPTGFRCRGTVCEDIYHPRREIKNY